MMLAPDIMLNNTPESWTSRIGFGICDELRDRLDRKRGIYRNEVGQADDARDWRDIADEIEVELVVKGRVDRVRCSDIQERIAVRGSAHTCLGADIAGGARSVFDDEGLAEALRQPFSYQARDDVRRVAGGIA